MGCHVPSADRARLGKQGEDLACRELRRRGYSILARGYRTRYGEIDIVARDGAVLVFVEVKARSTAVCGSPLDALTPLKQRRVAAMARSYLLRAGWGDRPCRFDVVGVRLEEGRRPFVEIIRGAFAAS